MRFSSRSSALQHTVFENRRIVSFSKITCGQTVLSDKSVLICSAKYFKIKFFQDIQ